MATPPSVVSPADAAAVVKSRRRVSVARGRTITGMCASMCLGRVLLDRRAKRAAVGRFRLAFCGDNLITRLGITADDGALVRRPNDGFRRRQDGSRAQIGRLAAARRAPSTFRPPFPR